MLINQRPSHVTQSINGSPAVFLSDQAGLPADFSIYADVGNDGDDDCFGFVLGFQPGDLANAAADYLLIDWK